MRQVILHIGMHKTGTTSIQASLNGIDSNGFRTMRFAEQNHSIPIYTIFSENRLNYHIWKKQGYNESQILEKKAAYEKILEEEIRDGSVDCFILSGEDMSRLTENEQINLCEFFKERNLKVRIIYVVREPFSFAASFNQHIAKGGVRALAKINPGYQSRISGFIKGCGRENISIFKYEQLIQDGLIRNFSEIIGVTLHEKPRANESVSAEALALIYSLNNIKTSTLGSKINYSARTEIIHAIRTFFSQGNGFKKLNLEKFDIVHEDVYEDLVWLEENFGISYQLPVKAEQQGLVYYEPLNIEILCEFFGKYGLNYQASISLADNLEKLYAKILRFEEINSQVQMLKNQEKLLDALKLSKKAIELGDERHSAYRQASNISHRLKELDDAIAFAKKAVDAKDNNDTSRANHKEHLANMLRMAGQLDDALAAVDELLETDEARYSAYKAKANILLDMQQVEAAKAAIQHSIELGDERHSAYRQASNISHRLKELDDAIAFAKKAVDAKDNNDTSRANHKEHLANMLRMAGQLDDALAAVDENE